MTNPIDVIKTRLQLQGQLSKSGDQHYKGFIRGSIQIVRDEGLVGLYKGLAPSVLREATYSTLRMGGYDVVKTYLQATDPKNTPLWKKLLAGAISGAFGACLANPADLVKVRMQAQAKAGGHQYSGLGDAFYSIYSKDGIRGLYKGVWPSTQRAALLTATQLACYDHIKHFLLNSRILKNDNIITHFCSSVVAGFFAAATTSPFDVVKSRIMNQPTPAPGTLPVYAGTLDCFAKTIKAEGMYGLYKGFIPNWMRIALNVVDIYSLRTTAKIGRIKAYLNPLSELRDEYSRAAKLTLGLMDDTHAWNSIFRFFGPKEALSLSLVCSYICNALKPIISERFIFRIPSEEKCTIYSPGRAIVHSYHSIPPTATQLTFIIFNASQYHDFMDHIPSTLRHMTLENYTTPTHYLTAPSPIFKNTNLPFIHYSGHYFNDCIDIKLLPLAQLVTGYFFDKAVDTLPPTLTSLTTGYLFDRPVDNLPPALIHLVLGHVFNQRVDKLPVSLRHLDISGGKFNQPVDKLPPTLTHLSLGDSFNQSVKRLPASLVQLTIGNKFNSTLRYLPSTLITLTLGNCFNKNVDKLPPTLTHLTVGHNFNKSVKNLPPSLTYLTTGKYFTQPLANIPTSCTHSTQTISASTAFYYPSIQDIGPLTFIEDNSCLSLHTSELVVPCGITQLILGDYFNCFVDGLPPTLTHLITGKNFDRPVDRLPHSLIFFSTGYKFNQPVNLLPPRLTYFKAGNAFNQAVNKLPPSLIHLIVGYAFNKIIDDLPPELRVLHLGDSFCESVDKLPRKLTQLTIGDAFDRPVDKLPQSLTHLVLGRSFHRAVDFLPASLVSLKVGDSFNFPATNLPRSLKVLQTGYLFNQPIDSLPPTLTHFSTHGPFNHPVDKLPVTLTHLSITQQKLIHPNIQFNQPLDKLPSSLLCLTVGHWFNQPIDKLPRGLTEFATGNSFNQPIDKLPRTLTHLYLGTSFKCSIDKLPPSLIHLQIGKKIIKMESTIQQPHQWKSPSMPSSTNIPHFRSRAKTLIALHNNN